jgi:hypothetical protein
MEFDDGIKANNKKHQGERGRGQWGANDPRALHPRDDSESLDDYARSSGVKLPENVIHQRSSGVSEIDVDD